MHTHAHAHEMYVLTHIATCFICIQIPVVHLASLRIGQDKSLHFPLGGLLWHILDETQLTLESNHGFID